MKRKQFHLTSVEERILRDLAKKNGLKEAELVREAIREYGEKHMKTENSLLQMAQWAKTEKSDSPGDLSVDHDRYLTEIDRNEK
ncbi:MAG TPA: hypothetical protein VFT51_02220 [Bacillales bacterium]|nr:hypothetical protein [Bacillales bacterium]